MTSSGQPNRRWSAPDDEGLAAAEEPERPHVAVVEARADLDRAHGQERRSAAARKAASKASSPVDGAAPRTTGPTRRA
jgi:hypothetical protein